MESMKAISQIFRAIVFVFVLFLSLPALSEVCSFSRMMGSFSDMDFTPSQSITRTQLHAQLETNATLFRRGKNKSVLNELAKKIEISPDDKKLIISLDDSCGWSDGNPITAQDMVLGIQMLFTPESEGVFLPGRFMLKNAEAVVQGNLPVSALGIRALDTHTIEIDLIASIDLLKSVLTYITFTPAPSHLLQDGKDLWKPESLLRVNSGPFTAQSQTDERIVLIRNPYYCAGFESNIEEITLLGVRDRSAPGLMFRQGLIDVAEELNQWELEALESSREYAPDFYKLEMPEDIMGYLFIGDSGVLGEFPKLREAIMLAVDFGRLHRVISGGKGNTSPHYSINFEFPNYQPLEHELISEGDYTEKLKRAKKIMHDHGYSAENNLPLVFFVRPSKPYINIAYALSSMLKQIFIVTQPEIEDNIKKRAMSDISLNAWGTDYPDPENTLSGIAGMLKKSNAESIGVALNHANQLIDTSERVAALHKIEQRLLNTLQFLPLFKVTSPWVLSSSLRMGDEFYVTGRNIIDDSCN